MQANPVIRVSVRCADGDGRLSSTKTYQRPRLVGHSLTAGHPTEMHYATSAGRISTGKMSQAKDSFFNRSGRGVTQRRKSEKDQETTKTPRHKGRNKMAFFVSWCLCGEFVFGSEKGHGTTKARRHDAVRWLIRILARLASATKESNYISVRCSEHLGCESAKNRQVEAAGVRRRPNLPAPFLE
jgi:hypothetical protein